MEDSHTQVIKSIDGLNEFLEKRPEFRNVMMAKAAGLTNQSTAEDLYQEMLVKACERLAKGATIGFMWGWAGIVLVRLAQKKWKKRGLEPQSLTDVLPDSLTIVSTVEKEEPPNLSAAISLLDDHHRLVLRSLQYEIPQGRLAQALGVSDATVTRRKHEATKKLGELLKSQPEAFTEVEDFWLRQPRDEQAVKIHIPSLGDAVGVLDFGEGFALDGRRFLAHVQVQGGNVYTVILRPRLRPTISLDSHWSWGIAVAAASDIVGRDPLSGLHMMAVHDSPGYRDTWASVRQEYILKSPWPTIEELIKGYRDFGWNVPDATPL